MLQRDPSNRSFKLGVALLVGRRRSYLAEWLLSCDFYWETCRKISLGGEA
jgi:hypothetical protein